MKLNWMIVSGEFEIAYPSDGLGAASPAKRDRPLPVTGRPSRLPGEFLRGQRSFCFQAYAELRDTDVPAERIGGLRRRTLPTLFGSIQGKIGCLQVRGLALGVDVGAGRVRIDTAVFAAEVIKHQLGAVA